MKSKTLISLILGAILLSACIQSTPLGTIPPPVATPTTPITVEVTPPPTSEPTEVLPTPTHLPVDLTPAQKAAVQAVSSKYNLPVDQIKIVSTEAVDWPNGCLGVVLPGVMCTDMIVPGFRILLNAGGQQFEIRTSQDGTNVVDAAQQLATLSFVVSSTDRTIQLVEPNIPLGPTYNPAFNGLLPTGASVSGTAYVLDLSTPSRAVAINAAGTHDLSFIQNPTYGLAVWRGGPNVSPLLAWGTQLSSTSTSSSLQINTPDGSKPETLLTIDSGNTPGALQLVAEFWSMDGQYLYFSKEPIGLGGYILFSGASDLYKINITTKEVTDVFTNSGSSSPVPCLNAISGDYQFIADACNPKVITIHDISSGGTATLQPPADVTGFNLVGSARFSPSGDRVAFAIAMGNPDNERGWVAVGSRTGGESKLVLVGDSGAYYTIAGWLDDQTLLVQSIPVACTTSCIPQLYTVGADGSNPTKVAEGTFLTVIDNR